MKVDFLGRFAVMVSFGIVDSCDGLFWHVWVTLHVSLSCAWSPRMGTWKYICMYMLFCIHFAYTVLFEATLHLYMGDIFHILNLYIYLYISVVLVLNLAFSCWLLLTRCWKQWQTPSMVSSRLARQVGWFKGWPN